MINDPPIINRVAAVAMYIANLSEHPHAQRVFRRSFPE
jgi:hypothetical protein